MTVPITSDLAGYQAFWLKVVFAAGAVAGVICVLLYRIVRLLGEIRFIMSVTHQ